MSELISSLTFPAFRQTERRRNFSFLFSRKFRKYIIRSRACFVPPNVEVLSHNWQFMKWELNSRLLVDMRRKLYWKGAMWSFNYFDIINSYATLLIYIWALCGGSELKRGSFVCLASAVFESAVLAIHEITLKQTNFPPFNSLDVSPRPQSNKYLINQSRISLLFFAYPFFKYLKWFISTRGSTKNINHQ